MHTPSTLVFFLLIGLLSCQTNSQPEPPQYNVPTEVEPFIQAFRQEAQQRNKTVSTDNLIVTFSTTSGADVCGECFPGKTPRIVLKNDDFCWQKANQQERECLVFHELGHCLLNRTHKTDKFIKGAFVSLMNPDNVAVYATCRYPLGDDECDKRSRRSYYVDELFDPATSTPTWGK